MTFQEFKDSLRSPGPVYVLATDQAYLRNLVFETCRDQVEESARGFDWAVIDLSETTPEQALMGLRTLPWMSSRRWVYLRDAHRGKEVLRPYLENPPDRVVVVLECGEKVREWSKFPQIEMGDGGSVVTRVQARARREGYRMSTEAAQLLVERVGDDYQALLSELEKQFLYCLDSKVIDLESVQSLVTEVRERDVFELIQAVGARDAELALRILGRLFEDGVSPQQTIAILYWGGSRLLALREGLVDGVPFHALVREYKLWSFKDREGAIRRLSRHLLGRFVLGLREADRLSKSTQTQMRYHLERLVVDTCADASV